MLLTRGLGTGKNRIILGLIEVQFEEVDDNSLLGNNEIMLFARKKERPRIHIESKISRLILLHFSDEMPICERHKSLATDVELLFDCDNGENCSS